jgi:hypothetical protein
MNDTQLQFCIPRSKCYLAWFHLFRFLLLKRARIAANFQIFSGKSSVLGTLLTKNMSTFCPLEKKLTVIRTMLRGHRRTYLTILKMADHAYALFKMQW